MGEEDLYEQAGTTSLTLAPRVLNLERVTDRLSELEDAVMDVVGGNPSMAVGEVRELLEVETSVE